MICLRIIKKCTAENGILDWIDLNSIDWEEGNQILLSAGKPGLLIKIRRLYNEPKIVYLAGDVTPFENTPYKELFLRVDNEFELHDGVNIAEFSHMIKSGHPDIISIF